LGRAGGLDVLVAEHAIVRPGLWKPRQPPDPKRQVRLEPRSLGDLVGRVLSAEHALDGQQGQAVLVDRCPQLIDRYAISCELLEQSLTRGALLALEPVEESRRGEVHLPIL